MTKPMLPAIGSTITAAIFFEFSTNNFSTESRLLNSAVNVSFAVFLVTPGLW